MCKALVIYTEGEGGREGEAEREGGRERGRDREGEREREGEEGEREKGGREGGRECVCERERGVIVCGIYYSDIFSINSSVVITTSLSFLMFMMKTSL